MTLLTALPDKVKQYLVITGNYWAFTLTDGALRMLIVLYFHQLGYSPLNIAMLHFLSIWSDHKDKTVIRLLCLGTPMTGEIESSGLWLPNPKLEKQRKKMKCLKEVFKHEPKHRARNKTKCSAQDKNKKWQDGGYNNGYGKGAQSKHSGAVGQNAIAAGLGQQANGMVGQQANSMGGINGAMGGNNGLAQGGNLNLSLAQGGMGGNLNLNLQLQQQASNNLLWAWGVTWRVGSLFILRGNLCSFSGDFVW